MNIIIGAFIFMLGAILASFAGVVIYRAPSGKSIIAPASFCPSCNRTIKWYDNIPIISFIILGGKCRYCKSKIGWLSFVIELLGGVGFLLAYLRFNLSYDLIFILALCFLFIIIGGIDYTTHYIYDKEQIVYFIIAIGYVLYKIFYLNELWYLSLIGLLIGFTFFYLIRVCGRLIMHQECLGIGDVILMSISGLLLGPGSLLLAILFGSLIGAIIELSLIGLRIKKRGSEIPFGPYLLLGVYISLLYGNVIIDWYLGLVM